METTSKISKFFENNPTHLYSAGSSIIDAGVTPDVIFYIKSGRVRMYDLSSSGYKLTLNILREGAFFALPWIYDNPNNFYFEALTDCKIIKSTIPKTKEFIINDPDLLNSFLHRLTLGFDGIFRRLSVHMSGTAEKRIITELLIEAWRFNKDDKGPKKIKISLNDLTSNTGLARETVSREISKMIDKKYIHKKGRTIFIDDIAQLEKVISEE